MQLATILFGVEGLPPGERQQHPQQHLAWEVRGLQQHPQAAATRWRELLG